MDDSRETKAERIIVFRVEGSVPTLPEDNLFTAVTGENVYYNKHDIVELETIALTDAAAKSTVDKLKAVLITTLGNAGWKNVTVTYVGSRLASHGKEVSNADDG